MMARNERQIINRIAKVSNQRFDLYREMAERPRQAPNLAGQMRDLENESESLYGELRRLRLAGFIVPGKQRTESAETVLHKLRKQSIRRPKRVSYLTLQRRGAA